MKSECITTSLHKIAQITTGKLNSNAAVANGEYPFFTCSPEILRINKYSFDEKAVLLAGNNAEGNFNIKYYEGKFNAYQRTYIITSIDDKICNLKYLYFVLKVCLQKFKLLSQGTSTKFLTLGILNSFEMLLPPLSEQKAIAAVLSALDDKIELNNRVNQKLEEMAQAIFKSWFVDFEPFQDGEFVESELGPIPKGWRVGSLLDIADYVNGLAMQKYRPSADERGIPVLKIKELRQGSCDNTSEECTPIISTEFIVHDGDVIFSWSGSLLVDFWCGGICGLNQHLFKVTSAKYDKWFYYMWTDYHLQRFIEIAKDKATTMGHIKREELRKAQVLIPDKDNYLKISSFLKPVYDLIVQNGVENRKLTETRDALLPKLMSGELRVPCEAE